MAGAHPAILIIDDNQQVLDGLVAALAVRLDEEDVDVNTWAPVQADEDPEQTFKDKLEGRTELVVTDYDLTTGGLRGLFGASIIAWSQGAAIPVGDFSRGQKHVLPKEPNLFELRVPANDEQGAAFIAATYRGFRELRLSLGDNSKVVLEKRSLAAVLATILGRPHLENQFAQYMVRLGAANAALIQMLRDLDAKPDPDETVGLMSYILGHVLANSILKFPGPLLGSNALCAYCATSEAEGEALGELFHVAAYKGPFREKDSLCWREDVDQLLEQMAAGQPSDPDEAFGDTNRRLVETALGRPLAAHACQRCAGRKGGFWCPFTLRPVCERSDCSVPSSSWVPPGAQLTRVERDFYDELAPLLGL